MMSTAVSITGMGILCAIGNDANAVLDSLRRKESGIGKMKYLKSVHSDIPVGEVKLSTAEMADILGVSSEKPVSRTSVMGALAVREALSQAGIADFSRKRTVLISGTTVGVMDLTEQYPERLKAGCNECGKSTLEIAESAGLKGVRCCTVSTACSSALNAIMLGAEMLKRDEADVVIAGGSEALSRFHLNGFNTLMILDRERCRPFDESRAGLNLGEGAAFVVLEKDSPRSIAYLEGYANRCDAFHQTATSKDGEGAFLAMRSAIEMAGIHPSDIRYVNAHGTGTPDNDASESAAFRRIFGDNVPDFSSTKSYTGHTTSASGSIETVICLLAMKNGFIPASLGWSRAIPGGPVPSQGRTGVNLDRVMCNSFGFGGNDSSLILSRNPPTEAGKGSDAAPFGMEKISSEVVSTDEALAGLQDFLSPMETRRMGKLMKASLLSAFAAMKQAGITCPDAIVTATSQGMYELSTQFLEDISANGEEHLKPTLFMQSTHNTVGSAIAIRTGCHGYNITYSQGDDSLFWALKDAERLISSGEACTVLVCSFDERLQDGKTKEFKAESMIFRRKIK